MYKNFSQAHPAWVDIHAIIDSCIQTEAHKFMESKGQDLDLQFQDFYRDDLRIPPFRMRSLCPACFGERRKRCAIYFDGCFQIKTAKREGYNTHVIIPRDQRDERMTVHNEDRVISLLNSCLIIRIRNPSIQIKPNLASISRPQQRQKWRRDLVTAAWLLRCVGMISHSEYSTFEGPGRGFHIRSAFCGTL
jgi:hypothetical protein